MVFTIILTFNTVATTGLGSFTWANPIDADTVIGYHPEMAATVGDTIQLADCWGNFEAVDYPGAFDPNETPWIKGWTAIDQYGYLSCCELRGDAKHNGGILVDDIVYLVNHLFKGGPAPVCLDEGDAKANGGILVDDIVYLVNHLFKGGPAPSPC